MTRIWWLIAVVIVLAVALIIVPQIIWPTEPSEDSYEGMANARIFLGPSIVVAAIAFGIIYAASCQKNLKLDPAVRLAFTGLLAWSCTFILLWLLMSATFRATAPLATPPTEMAISAALSPIWGIVPLAIIGCGMNWWRVRRLSTKE